MHEQKQWDQVNDLDAARVDELDSLRAEIAKVKLASEHALQREASTARASAEALERALKAEGARAAVEERAGKLAQEIATSTAAAFNARAELMEYVDRVGHEMRKKLGYIPHRLMRADSRYIIRLQTAFMVYYFH